MTYICMFFGGLDGLP